MLASLVAYGVKFFRNKANKSYREDLLAGLLWLHASHDVGINASASTTRQLALVV